MIKWPSATTLILIVYLTMRATMLHAQTEVPPVVMSPLVYAEHCVSCHGSPETSRAPSRDALKERSPETIYEALNTGSMSAQGDNISDMQKKALAIFLSGRPFGLTDNGHASSMTHQCESQSIGNPLNGPAWNGWGADLGNSRYQPNPGIAEDEWLRVHQKFA